MASVDSSSSSLIPWRAPATIAAVVVMFLGLALRWRGQTSLELWADEADWAIRAVNGTDTFIRPVGTMWLARALVAVHNSEVMLRLPSLIAGVAHLALLWLLLRRLVRAEVAVLGMLALAVHPVAVEMAKEFKPYAIEACLHTLLLLLTVRWLHAPSRRGSVGIGVLAAVSPLLSWSIVFAYPGTFLVGLMRAGRDRRRGQVVIFVVGAIVTLLVLAALFLARVQNEDRKADYWGKKYDVFFTGDGVVNQLAWLANKTALVAMQPGRLGVSSWSSSVLSAMAGLLVVLGLVVLARRRAWEVQALLVFPVLSTLVFNVARQWPWGGFRTNFYLLPMMIILATIGVDGFLSTLARLHRRAVAAAFVFVAVATLAAVPAWWSMAAHKSRRHQTGQASVHRAMQLLRAVETTSPTTTKPVLLLDGHACGLFRYYRDHHSAGVVANHDWYVAHIDERCGTVGNGWFPLVDSMAGRDFWLMVVQRKHEAQTLKRLRAECVVEHLHKLPGMTLLYCRR